MKKLLYITLVFPLLLGYSCSVEVDDIFSKDATSRASQELLSYKTTLESAENGWLLEYFPHVDRIYGGANFILKFEEGIITSMTDRRVGVIEESFYKLSSPQGPVLSFDTGADNLFYYVTPSGSSTLYQGRGGDFEFVLLSQTSDVIELKGRSSGNFQRLVRLDDNQSWSGYLQEVTDMEAIINAGNFNLIVNGEQVGTVTMRERTLIFSYLEPTGQFVVDENGDEIEILETISETVAFIYRPKGITLYEAYTPYKMSGISAREFEFNSRTRSFAATDGADIELVNINQ